MENVLTMTKLKFVFFTSAIGYAVDGGGGKHCLWGLMTPIDFVLSFILGHNWAMAKRQFP